MAANSQIDDFEYRPPDRSHTGLMLRFARGRVRAFQMRNVATVVGSGVLAVLVSPILGLVTCVVALLGEMVDLLVLRKVPSWIDGGMSRKRLDWITSASAAFQAITIAVCVLATHVYSGSHASLFFALAFLSGAIMNAGLYVPYHHRSSLTRIGIYVCTLLAAVIYSQFEYQDVEETIFTVLAAVVLAGMCYAMVHFVVTNQRRFRQIETALVARSAALETKNSELAKAQRETRQLAQVAQNANDSVIMSTPDGQITWVNQAFTRITGFEAHEAIGKRPAEFLNGPETDEDGIKRIIEARDGGREIRIEIFNYTKDGRKIWVDTNIVPIKNDTGDVEMLINIERDVTQAKAQMQELEIAKNDAEAGAKAKSEFLATMSHEIRTPMNAILGMSDLLCHAGLPKEQSEQAAIISQNADELMRIIGDILDLSELDSNRLHLDPARFDLRAMVQTVERGHRKRADEKAIEFLVNISDCVPETVVLDARRLKQVVDNVVGNAVKFTEQGQLQLHVDVQSKAGANVLTFTVTDTGVGIAADKLASIFEQFSQAEGSRTREFGGAGLGLAISRHLAELMGGEIAVTSILNHGSEFVISVPLPADTRVDRAFGTQQPSVIPIGTRVLIAEDTAMNRTILSKYTKGVECKIQFAVNGAEAVEKVAEFSPDVVFMDISMPVMDGIEATKVIRSRYGGTDEVPIVALTANALDSDREQCFAAGMNAFLSKPIRKADFLTAIAQWSQYGKT